MRLGFAAIGLVALFSSGPPAFRGCADGGDLPTDGEPLPREEGCNTDDDCASTCEDVRCVAGACMTIATILDADEDGRAPTPCGDDCDDADPSRFSGARETCDRRD